MELRSIQEAMESRHSVRSYLSTPIPQDITLTLRQTIKEYSTQARIRIQLVTDEPEAFSGFMAHYGHFVCVRNYITFVADKDGSQDELVGYYGEKLVLLAQQLGLSSCWVAASYRKRKCPVVVNPGEKLVCVIALGYGVSRGNAHKNRPLNQISNLEDASPMWFRSGMMAVLLAPTAMNQQRFFFRQEGDTVEARSTGGPYSKIDLGIAKYHFELGAGTKNFRWKEDAPDASAEAPEVPDEDAVEMTGEAAADAPAETPEDMGGFSRA